MAGFQSTARRNPDLGATWPQSRLHSAAAAASTTCSGKSLSPRASSLQAPRSAPPCRTQRIRTSSPDPSVFANRGDGGTRPYIGIRVPRGGRARSAERHGKREGRLSRGAEVALRHRGHGSPKGLHHANSLAHRARGHQGAKNSLLLKERDPIGGEAHGLPACAEAPHLDRITAAGRAFGDG